MTMDTIGETTVAVATTTTATTGKDDKNNENDNDNDNEEDVLYVADKDEVEWVLLTAREYLQADICLVSACEDEQKSAGVNNVRKLGLSFVPQGTEGGACTSLILQILYRHYKQQQYVLEQRQAKQEERSSKKKREETLRLQNSSKIRVKTIKEQKRLSYHDDDDDDSSSSSSSWSSDDEDSSSSSSSDDDDEEQLTMPEPLTYAQILNHMKETCQRNHYAQIPQLSTSRPTDMERDVLEIVKPNAKGGGTKRALLVGINYEKTPFCLTGCHYDCHNVKTYLEKVHDFLPQNMTLLLDDGIHTLPTRANLLQAFSKFALSCQPGDSVVFHFSGHGGLVVDDSGDEASGFDQALLPVDYLDHGEIIDDEIFRTLLLPLPKGVHMTAIVDCCHSGTIFDLPFEYTLGQTETDYASVTFPHMDAVHEYMEAQQAMETIHNDKETKNLSTESSSGRRRRASIHASLNKSRCSRRKLQARSLSPENRARPSLCSNLATPMEDSIMEEEPLESMTHNNNMKRDDLNNNHASKRQMFIGTSKRLLQSSSSRNKIMPTSSSRFQRMFGRQKSGLVIPKKNHAVVKEHFETSPEYSKKKWSQHNVVVSSPTTSKTSFRQSLALSLASIGAPGLSGGGIMGDTKLSTSRNSSGGSLGGGDDKNDDNNKKVAEKKKKKRLKKDGTPKSDDSNDGFKHVLPTKTRKKKKKIQAVSSEESKEEEDFNPVVGLSAAIALKVDEPTAMTTTTTTTPTTNAATSPVSTDLAVVKKPKHLKRRGHKKKEFKTFKDDAEYSKMDRLATHCPELEDMPSHNNKAKNEDSMPLLLKHNRGHEKKYKHAGGTVAVVPPQQVVLIEDQSRISSLDPADLQNQASPTSPIVLPRRAARSLSPKRDKVVMPRRGRKVTLLDTLSLSPTTTTGRPTRSLSPKVVDADNIPPKRVDLEVAAPTPSKKLPRRGEAKIRRKDTRSLSPTLDPNKAKEHKPRRGRKGAAQPNASPTRRARTLSPKANSRPTQPQKTKKEVDSKNPRRIPGEILSSWDTMVLAKILPVKSKESTTKKATMATDQAVVPKAHSGDKASTTPRKHRGKEHHKKEF